MQAELRRDGNARRRFQLFVNADAQCIMNITFTVFNFSNFSLQVRGPNETLENHRSRIMEAFERRVMDRVAFNRLWDEAEGSEANAGPSPIHGVATPEADSSVSVDALIAKLREENENK